MDPLQTELLPRTYNAHPELKMDQEVPPEGLSTLLEQIYNVQSPHIWRSACFRRLLDCQWDKEDILSSIPNTSHHAERSLRLLHALLTDKPGPWPTIPLIRRHARLLKLLPDNLKLDTE